MHGETWSGPTPHFRPRHQRAGQEAAGPEDTNDRDIWQSVFVENEYEVPHLLPDDVVLDIGQNIGAFSVRAWVNGSRRVFGFEPDRGAFEMAVKNTLDLGLGISCANYAVVRSDERWNERLFLRPRAMRVMREGVAEDIVWPKPLDTILAEHRRVRLLKIDCEGWEWPILYTSALLNRVHEIVGEYHEGEGERVGWPDAECRIKPLADYLSDRGFRVSWTPGSGPLGLFRATR
jgi:FkbM family methyltransferase